MGEFNWRKVFLLFFWASLGSSTWFLLSLFVALYVPSSLSLFIKLYGIAADSACSLLSLSPSLSLPPRHSFFLYPCNSLGWLTHCLLCTVAYILATNQAHCPIMLYPLSVLLYPLSVAQIDWLRSDIKAALISLFHLATSAHRRARERE